MIKTIPFSIEAWKAGGKPVTRDGIEVKQLTRFKNVTETTKLRGVVEGCIVGFTHFDLMLQVEVKEPREWEVYVHPISGLIYDKRECEGTKLGMIRVREVLE